MTPAPAAVICTNDERCDAVQGASRRMMPRRRIAHSPSTYKTASLLPESRSHTPTKRPTCLAQECREPRHRDYCSLRTLMMCVGKNSNTFIASAAVYHQCSRASCICCCAAVKLALAAAAYVFCMQSAARSRMAAALALQLMVLCLLTANRRPPSARTVPPVHAVATAMRLKLLSNCGLGSFWGIMLLL